jgi:hypothetical protein
MRDFWKRRRDRADWPEPRTEFVNSLADEVREARSQAETRNQARIGRFRLAFVLAVFVLLLVPVVGFAGSPSGGDGAGAKIEAVVSYLQANTVAKASPFRSNDDDDDGGGGGGGGDDDDDGGGGGGGGGGGDDDDDGGGGDDDDDDDYRGGDDDDDDGGGGDDDDDGGGGGGDDDDD